jgi:gamma-glutamylcyclotransferase (GGCT)/AIG2-like uncharacterized protein YtfP
VEHLFIYGTLINSELLKSIIGRVAVACPDKLSGYQYKEEAFVFGEEIYPGIEECGELSVDGIVYDVYPEELTLVDQYEGGRYNRKQVQLESGINAFVYIPISIN